MNLNHLPRLKFIILCWLVLMVVLVYFDALYFDGINHFRPGYFDMLLHFLGGGFIAASFLYFAGKNLFGALSDRFLPLAFLTLGAVVLVALNWEFYEYFVNIYLQLPQEPIADTFSDLALGLAGGALTVCVIRKLSNSKL